MKGIYKVFQNQQIHTPSAVLKWNEDLGADIQKWEQYFLLPYKITRTVYLQNFQFCLLHRIIPHGTLLYKMNINTHDICSLCEHERDTILHRFFECGVIASLWRELEVWWKEVTYIEIDLRLYDSIFGILDQKDDRLNFIILLVKYHIHRRLIDGDKEITWVVCKKYLKFELIALEYTMIRHNQEEIFNNDWKQILNKL